MKRKKIVLFALLFALIIVYVVKINSTVKSSEIKDSNTLIDDNMDKSKLDINSNEKASNLADENNNSKDNSQLKDELETLVDEPETEDDKDKIDYLKNTTYENKEGKFIIKNTEDILVLVNKERNLPSDYIPKDLVVPNVQFSFKEDIPKRYLRKEAAIALEKLFKKAEKDDIVLYAVSGYRSYIRQKSLFYYEANKIGEEKAILLVAFPGQSEHQTGLAMDVSSKSANYLLEENFGQTVEGRWLKENAHKFGFIIRYPKEKVDITGYNYEPWHIRYVGKEVANELNEKLITLEEYFGFQYSK